MDRLVIKVRDFSKVPGSRYRNEGQKAHSGEQFREDFLEPLLAKHLKDNSKIVVDLDGTIGYGTSWLEEVFGGLARKYGKSVIMQKLQFKSVEEPYLIDDILEYIKRA